MESDNEDSLSEENGRVIRLKIACEVEVVCKTLLPVKWKFNPKTLNKF